MVVERVLKEKFPPYRGPEWERKINNPSHANFWKYGVVNLIFKDFVGDKRVILDVGCGTGGSTCLLAKNCEVDLIVGVDIVKTMIQVAKEKARGEGLQSKIELIVCDGRQLPFRDSSFEALVSRGDVLVWPIPQDEALREFDRVVKAGAVIAMEMDNGALIKVNTTNCYFQKTSDGEIAYVVNRFDANRDSLSTHYVLRRDSAIAKGISQTQEFMKTAHYIAEYPVRDVEEETMIIKQGLTTHWYTAEELRDLFEASGFEEIEVIGDGLLMKLLLEGNGEIVEVMRKQPEVFLEIEKRLVPFVDANKAATIIVRASKK